MARNVSYDLEPVDGDLPPAPQVGHKSALDVNVIRVKATEARYGKWNVIAKYANSGSVAGAKGTLKRRYPDVEFEHRGDGNGGAVLYARYSPAA